MFSRKSSYKRDKIKIFPTINPQQKSFKKNISKACPQTKPWPQMFHQKSLFQWDEKKFISKAREHVFCHKSSSKRDNKNNISNHKCSAINPHTQEIKKNISNHKYSAINDKSSHSRDKEEYYQLQMFCHKYSNKRDKKNNIAKSKYSAINPQTKEIKRRILPSPNILL